MCSIRFDQQPSIGNYNRTMVENRLAPKYILLNSPTLKYSRSSNGQRFDVKNGDLFLKHRWQRVQDKGDTIGEIKESTLAQNLETIRVELNHSMQNLAIEQKRNNVLMGLNLLLQDSNREAEEREKLEVKPQEDRERRRVEKEEYEIDQISQKYNEEVARITSLREQVNSARTDRVVFQALFKKIEWEIKHYASLYWETIIKTQLQKSAKEEKLLEKRLALEGQNLEELEGKEETVICQPHSNVGGELSNRFFMTHPQKHSTPPHKKFTEILTDPSFKLLNKIRDQQGKIDKIVKKAECRSAEETVLWYCQLGNENRRLRHLIEGDQWSIEEIEGEIERLRAERRDSEVTGERHMKKLKSIPSTRKLRSCRHFKAGSDEIAQQTATQIVQKLAKLSNISVVDRSLEQVLGEVQQMLCGQQCLRVERTGGHSDSSIQNLLIKMQRFQSCQRILSKQQFQGQYLRQLSRQKRQIKTKK